MPTERQRSTRNKAKPKTISVVKPVKSDRSTYTVLRCEYAKEPLQYELLVSKILWTLMNANSDFCHSKVSSNYILRSFSIAKPEEDSVLWVIFAKKPETIQVAPIYNLLDPSLNKTAKARNENLKKTIPTHTFPVLAFAVGTVIRWNTTALKKVTKGKKQAAPLSQWEYAFEIEDLCSAVMRKGFGSLLLDQIQAYVKQNKKRFGPTKEQLKGIWLSSVDDTGTLAFYKKQGFTKPALTSKRDANDDDAIWLYKSLR